MEGSHGYIVQDHKDVKKVCANDETRNGRRYSGDGYPAGVKSIITASTDVTQPGGFVIKVGAIGCSAFGSQRCNFRPA